MFRMYVFLALRYENTSDILDSLTESMNCGLPIGIAFLYRVFVRIQCLAWKVLVKFGAYVLCMYQIDRLECMRLWDRAYAAQVQGPTLIG
jgi:hypothetical protein